MAQHDRDDDRRQIAGLLDRCIDGSRSGRRADMHELFHAHATICGYVGPDPFAGPIRMFHDWHDGTWRIPGKVFHLHDA